MTAGEFDGMKIIISNNLVEYSYTGYKFTESPIKWLLMKKKKVFLREIGPFKLGTDKLVMGPRTWQKLKETINGNSKVLDRLDGELG